MIEIATALIAGMAVIFAAVIPVWGKRFGKQMASMQSKLERVRGQVENDHSGNMREEQDDRHKEIVSAIGHVRADIGGIRSDVRNLHRADQQLDQRVQRVESTTNRIIKEKNE